METSISFLNVDSTVCAWAVLAVVAHPVLRLLVVWIAVFPDRIILLARKTSVPGDLVLEAHFKLARGTDYMRVRVFILLVYFPIVAICA